MTPVLPNNPPQNICKTLLTRELTYNPSSTRYNKQSNYSNLIKTTYKRVATNPRKVFKTLKQSSLDLTNPVYDIQYSPACYDGYRVIGVGDEHGYLSVVKVGYEGVNKNVEYCEKSSSSESFDKKKFRVQCSQEVWNRGVTTLSTNHNNNDLELTPPPPNSQDIQPVVYTLDWNESGDKILSGYGDGSLRVWDVGKRATVFKIDAYQKSVKRVVWGSEATIISCSRTNEIKVHDNRMRTPCVNKIDVNNLNTKLTDIGVLQNGSYNYVVSTSSNSSAISLWDLRYTYKLYKRVRPVETWDGGSTGYACVAVDKDEFGESFYVLGVSDSVVSRVGGGSVVRGWRVPEQVDYFSKLRVDRGVGVCGGCGVSAYGFWVGDHQDKEMEGGLKDPFFELRDGKVLGCFSDWRCDWGRGDKDGDKENTELEGGVVGGLQNRCACAVGVWVSRSGFDFSVQIATGGDDSYVTVWD